MKRDVCWGCNEKGLWGVGGGGGVQVVHMQVQIYI